MVRLHRLLHQRREAPADGLPVVALPDQAAGVAGQVFV